MDCLGGIYPPQMLEYHKLLGGLGEHLAAVRGEDCHVLDAHAEFPRQIAARLGRDRCPLWDDLLLAAAGVGTLVDLQAHTVAVPVAEKRTVPGILNDLTGSTVNFLTGKSRLGGG